jgi:hypothetical protein
MAAFVLIGAVVPPMTNVRSTTCLRLRVVASGDHYQDANL